MSDWKDDLPNAYTSSRESAIETVINDARRACQMEPLAGDDLIAMVGTWQRVLAAVPSGKISELATAAMRAKGSGYPITASEVFDLWDKPNRAQRSQRESALDRTYHEEIGARTAEEEELRVLQFQESERKRRAEQRYATDLMERGVCKCEVPGKLSADGTVFMCAQGRCDLRWMNPEMIHIEVARLKEKLHRDWGRMPSARLPEIEHRAPRQESPTGTAPRPSDDEILSLLGEYCGFNVESVGRETALEFGDYILRMVSITGFTEQDAKSLWPDFRAGLLLHGDGGGTAGGGSRAEAAEAVGR